MYKIFPILSFVILFSCFSPKIIDSSIPKIKRITEAAPYFSKQKINREIALKNYIQSVTFYNENGNIVEKYDYSPSDSIFVFSKKEIISFDKKGQPQKGNIYDKDGNLVEYWVSVYDKNSNSNETKTYNAEHKIIKTQSISYDENGNKIEKSQYNSDYSQFSTVYKYNEKNQLTEYLNSSSNGNAIRVLNYDEKGNQIEQIYTKPDGEIITYRYGYDAENNLIFTKRYDAQGNLKNETLYEFEFDKYGNWITKKSIFSGNHILIYEREIEYFK